VTLPLVLFLSGCTLDKSLLPALIHASIVLHVGDADMFWLMPRLDAHVCGLSCNTLDVPLSPVLSILLP
jgi:hypothetical protein